MKVLMFFYNIFMPIGFCFFVPGLLWKLWRRPGWKSTFGERFAHFSAERQAELSACHGAIWVHAVSVGESVIALALVKKLRARHPEIPVVLSTGTTTGQELVRKQLPDGVHAIFCPIDFLWMVRRTLRLIQPRMLVILETEIWPNLLIEAHKSGAKTALVNARLSDHSARGYKRFACFFKGLFGEFDVIAAQSAMDAERFLAVSPEAHVIHSGNLKFDQSVPADLAAPDWTEYFGQGEHLVLTAASTHPGEEALILKTFAALSRQFSTLKLVIVPRHAERGGEVFDLVKNAGLSGIRRSLGTAPGAPVDVLVADTTGEMLKIMKSSDIVIMGKSLAGYTEGHNLIEPALLKKAIVTGATLSNFRFLLQILTDANAVATVTSDAQLEGVLAELLRDNAKRNALGEAAFAAVSVHAGATQKTLDALDALQ